ncbi:hypothetical protein K0M31_007327 [Melipona bicolor]|uniref:Uncharacterized protein n=1 Tax=Melipona bicolor TaxID=60889 RepID=A0AA40GBF8_9HYME|nr:hypothetical protein K0M31_007327 [Melipona bicolor]
MVGQSWNTKEKRERSRKRRNEQDLFSKKRYTRKTLEKTWKGRTLEKDEEKDKKVKMANREKKKRRDRKKTDEKRRTTKGANLLSEYKGTQGRESRKGPGKKVKGKLEEARE